MTATEGELLAQLRPLARAARRLAPGRADDIVQDTLLAVLRRLDQGHEIDNLGAYCRQTLRNLAKSGPRPLPEGEVEDLPAPASAHLELKTALEAIAAMSGTKRQLLLACLRGASYREMAAETGLPLGTVMSRLSRARAELRAALDLPPDHAVEALLAP